MMMMMKVVVDSESKSSRFEAHASWNDFVLQMDVRNDEPFGIIRIKLTPWKQNANVKEAVGSSKHLYRSVRPKAAYAAVMEAGCEPRSDYAGRLSFVANANCLMFTSEHHERAAITGRGSTANAGFQKLRCMATEFVSRRFACYSSFHAEQPSPPLN
eukprot:scaffold366441_cov30-Prasinocladus_malaysianus.AAC.1